MIIRTISIRKIKWLLLILPVCVILIAVLTGLLGNKAIGAYSQDKVIPIYSVDNNDKKVAITFDCAWGADDIPEILSVLKKEDVKATFFIVGNWADKYLKIVKMISDEGHDVANHGYSHLRMGGMDIGKTISEITLCDEKLNKITGQKIDLFRPPYGDYDNSLVNAAKDLGYYTIQWDVDSLDWKPGISREEIMSRINSRVKSGSIILFHNDTAHTAKLLPEIISNLKRGGYGFLPVSKMILKQNYYIDYTGRQKSIVK